MGKRGSRSIPALLVWLLLAWTAAACGAGETTPADEPKQPAVQQQDKPSTIKIALTAAGYLTEDEFKQYIVEPVKRKYPHITVERVTMDFEANSLDKIVASGNIPDIVIYASPLMDYITDMALDFDMEPLIKKHDMDLNRFENVTLDSIRVVSQKNYLVAIPYSMQINAMYYNKDIFDKFGAPYPKDGMTWEEVRELAKRVTRMDGGVQYRGLEPDYVYRVASALALPMIDAKTMKAAVNTDAWRNVFETVRSIYDIPGNSKIQYAGAGQDAFVKDRNVAMLPSLNVFSKISAAKDLNWDMVTYPSFPSAKGTGMQIDEHFMLITTSSKNKDDALKVIMTVTSDEVQRDMVQNGRLTVLKDEKIKADFGKNLPLLAGKNVHAVLKTKPALAVVSTKHGAFARDRMMKAMEALVKREETDVTTVLRKAEEEINKNIEANQTK